MTLIVRNFVWATSTQLLAAKCLALSIGSYQANVHCRCPQEHSNAVGMVRKFCRQVVARCFYNIHIIWASTKIQYKSGTFISDERSQFFRAEIVARCDSTAGHARATYGGVPLGRWSWIWSRHNFIKKKKRSSKPYL